MKRSGSLLKIALDARVLVMQPTGIGRYTRSLLGALQDSFDSHFEAVLFTHKPIVDEVYRSAPFRQVVLPYPDPMLLRFFWDEVLLPRAIRREGNFDLYFSPLSVIPSRLFLPSVATLHDLAFLHDATFQPGKYRFYWRRTAGNAVRRATRLIAVSEATRSDLERFFPGSEKKATVIHEAPDACYHYHDNEDGEESRMRTTYGRYFLAVGTLEPRKNYPFLLRVFRMFLEQSKESAIRLIVAGGKGWASARELSRERERLGDRLICLDYVDVETLKDLYRGAVALLFPSLYEGFGLPLVEAMAMGTPVVASNVSSIPEVLGDAGVLLPPDQEAEWIIALNQLIEDEDGRRSLREKSRERVRRFSWERAAQETWAVFREVCGR